MPADRYGLALSEIGRFAEAIRVLQPLVNDHDRIGGSRAQRDLVEYTLLKSYIESGREREARALLARPRFGTVAPRVARL